MKRRLGDVAVDHHRAGPSHSVDGDDREACARQPALADRGMCRAEAALNGRLTLDGDAPNPSAAITPP